MESCDVLIVGGGPAGSTCAWKLRHDGFDVVVIDKEQFPRDKTCAGWIVPQVIDLLQLDVADYSAGRVWQPITGFQVGLWDRPGTVNRYGQPVSYGIRRCEFDDYLLMRSGARLRLAEPVRQLVRTPDGWLVNGSLKARLLIGAGGNFCPVARHLRGPDRNPAPLVTAVELEVPIADQPINNTLDGTTPQLYFCKDLAGYGWCVRKQSVLNIGVGRVNARDVPVHWEQLLERLRGDGILTGSLPKAPHGHAYHVYDGPRAPLHDERVLLIGDSAGLAEPHSGEGIRPAIESALLAAETIREAQGKYDRPQLQRYATRIQQRFGASRSTTGSQTPQPLNAWQTWTLRWLFGQRWFSRHFVLNRWFLHS